MENRSWAKKGGYHLPTVAVRWHHMFSVMLQWCSFLSSFLCVIWKKANLYKTSRPIAAPCCCLLKALKSFTILPANVPPVNIPSAKLRFLHNNNFFFFFFFFCLLSFSVDQLTTTDQETAEKGSCSLIQTNILLNPPHKCATSTHPMYSNQNKNTGTSYLIN